MLMGWFSKKPQDPAVIRRENKRLHQLVAEQKEEIERLRQQMEAERLVHDHEMLERERELQEIHSTVHIQQIELRQQALVIERDRSRVQAELAGHAVAQALANQAKQMRQGNGQVLKSDKDSSGG